MVVRNYLSRLRKGSRPVTESLDAGQEPVIVAGIQSVFKRACELDAFDVIIVDEAHLLPPDGEGMYQTFLAESKVVNPNVRLIGLTATPYRLKSGMLCGPENLLNHVCFEIGVKELIVQGFLSPLKTKSGRRKAEFAELHVRSGEFISSEVESLIDTDELVSAACREIAFATRERRSVLIFAASVAHAQHVQAELQSHITEDSAVITGETSAALRAELIDRCKGKPIPANLFGDPKPPFKYLINVNVLTTGFDAPNVDCVVLLRPTASAGLYYQMVGRGFRLQPGKQDCLILDYGDNILRHGPVDAIQIVERHSTGGEAPANECPNCQTVVHAAYTACPECGFTFPPPKKSKHGSHASSEGILSNEVTDTEYEVHDVAYHVHVKRDADESSPRTMRVDYRLGLNHWQSEWVCIEHTGFARQKAMAWWRQRSPDPFPESAERAVQIANAGGLAAPQKISVRSIAGEKYDRIIACELGEMPEPVQLDEALEFDDSEVPF